MNQITEKNNSPTKSLHFITRESSKQESKMEVRNNENSGREHGSTHHQSCVTDD